MPRPVSVRSGQVEFLKLNLEKREWRDAYQWLLALTWPEFAALIAAIAMALAQRNNQFVGCEAVATFEGGAAREGRRLTRTSSNRSCAGNNRKTLSKIPKTWHSRDKLCSAGLLG